MKLLLLHLFLLSGYILSGQEITGRWYSKDGTRIYQIYKKGDQFEAVLIRSSRKKDNKGILILRNVKSRDKKRKFEGQIYSLDGLPAFAKIKIQKDNQVLRIRVRRMFFLNVTIKWYKDEG